MPNQQYNAYGTPYSNGGQPRPACQPQPAAAPYQQPALNGYGSTPNVISVNSTPITSEMQLPYNFRPLGMWSYFGYNILFGIPLVGLIMLFIFALGSNTNIHLRNYSRYLLCVRLFFLVTGFIGFMMLMSR